MRQLYLVFGLMAVGVVGWQFARWAFPSSRPTWAPPVRNSLAPRAAVYRSRTPDWSENAPIPASGHRGNIFQLEEAEFRDAIYRGKVHLLWHPFGETGLLFPAGPFMRAAEESRARYFQAFLGSSPPAAKSIKSMADFYHWLGLYDYPQGAGAATIPYPQGSRPDFPMGVTFVKRNDAVGLTYSCAVCHSGQLFGQSILGMSNRVSRASESFVRSKMFLPQVSPELFRLAGASAAEARLLEETAGNLAWIGLTRPSSISLDTGLAQLGQSLARREIGPYANLADHSAIHPRPSPLGKLVTDTKPGVWWTVKYKTRFLMDGSLLGNPIEAQLFWGEIMRATDLERYELWSHSNSQTILRIAAVFAAESPCYTDFFPASSLDPKRARQGQQLFNKHCARCHGVYKKRWDDRPNRPLPMADYFKTVQVIYPSPTPVKEVGTDPQRYLGMQALAEQLNALQPARIQQLVVHPRRGYVPPPLVGIWARWPYFHNNSAPTLHAVLTRSERRPRSYYAGEALDPSTDFDAARNGYPIADRAPAAWRQDPDNFFDTTRPGLSNNGHDEGIFLKNGEERLTEAEKFAIIEFLKTL